MNHPPVRILEILIPASSPRTSFSLALDAANSLSIKISECGDSSSSLTNLEDVPFDFPFITDSTDGMLENPERLNSIFLAT